MAGPGREAPERLSAYLVLPLAEDDVPLLPMLLLHVPLPLPVSPIDDEDVDDLPLPVAEDDEPSSADWPAWRFLRHDENSSENFLNLSWRQLR